MTTAVVYSCCHAHPSFDNQRALVLGEFIYQLDPDYVIDLGDTADMNSLCSHEKPTAVPLTTYDGDIAAYHDFQEKLRWPYRKAKKKKPVWIGLEGNHENRIRKALSEDPRLEGAVSFRDLEVERYFNEYVPYENRAPGIFKMNRTLFAHYFCSGNMGRPMSNVHLGYTLVKKHGMSAIMGHTHKRSHYMDDGLTAGPAQGLSVGCMIDYDQPWAGQSNRDWWAGCVVLHNWEPDGTFDVEWVSLKTLKEGK